MSENLVYNCKSAAFHQHFGKDNLICNNVFVNQEKEQLAVTRKEDRRSFIFENNVVCYSGGLLLSKNWDKAAFDARKNLYWNFNGPVSFKDRTLQEWQTATGKDAGSIVADPGFVDFGGCDFTMKNAKALKKIDFHPFNPAEAGVLGTEEWRKLSEMDSERRRLFERTISLQDLSPN